MTMFYSNKNKGLYNPLYEHDNCGVGFIANINGKKSHNIIEQGIEILVNLTHRGAVGGDEDTGDGAGILFQLPKKFFKKMALKESIKLPENEEYGVGMVFLPTKKNERDYCKKIIEETIKKHKLEFLGWRKVPVRKNYIGNLAQSTIPKIKQFFVKLKNKKENLEKNIFIARKIIESKFAENNNFYIVSFSSKTIVYKGLLLATQIKEFYPDLSDSDLESGLAIVHQRYSTNTFPTWALAQPFRMLAHNGEINTLRGNMNWIYAREKTITSKFFGKDLKKLLPIINPNCSDSMALDNILEFLVACGRSLPHAMMMLVPEAWGKKYPIGPDKVGFYEYHSILMEPWDGPAALAFTDGKVIGANLDRNGLRPARYLITEDDTVIMASEAGVIEVPPEKIKERGRVRPGKMFFIDTEQARIINDEEIKSKISRQQSYRRWIEENKIEIGTYFGDIKKGYFDKEQLVSYQRNFGYTYEDINILLIPMATQGKEPVGSMGNDAALAVLSNKPQLLFNYFKQLFAQVTNPAIDSIREELVMSLMSYVGIESNLLDETPVHSRLLKLKKPILTNRAMSLLRHSESRGLRTITIPIVFPVSNNPSESLETALEEVCKNAEIAVQNNKSLIILSDKTIDEKNIAIPSLLAVSTVHNYLIKKGLRTKIGLIIETGEVREVMHFALLLGFGVSAINPYLAFETIIDLYEKEYLNDVLDLSEAIEKYIHSIEKGLLKIFAKMGISTIRSYRGARIFEPLGLSQKFLDKYFPNMISKINGIGLDIIAEEYSNRHKKAFKKIASNELYLERGGIYNYRKGEEEHLWTPNTIRLLQEACREKNYKKYKEYAGLINNQDKKNVTLRSLLEFNNKKKIPLSKVESVKSIIKRFVTGAMSFGSLSKEVHETMAIAMNRLGIKSNSGEGGEDPIRFKPDANGNLKCSAIKQVASGRFGVTIDFLVNSKEIQIKIAQGAKPGEGGQLPGHKVGKEIARVRNTMPGITLISPPPHHDIYSIEDLAQLIYDLKSANPDARISVKLVSEAGVGTVAAGVAKAKADMILISGYDGGTGATPLSSMKHAGLPWELGLSETQQTLLANNLRDCVTLQVDGQIKTGRDVVIGAILGAEEFGFGTTALIVLGCMMMRKCHLNTCPMGVATQDPELRQKFKGQPEHLINFLTFIATEVREILSELGYKKLDDIIGNVKLLKKKSNLTNKKIKGINFDKILYSPETEHSKIKTKEQRHHMDYHFDNLFLEDALKAIKKNKKFEYKGKIRNVNRSAGILLSSRISKYLDGKKLKNNFIVCEFNGVAGQSFAGFLNKGITFKLFGTANDYVGKGLSGGKIIIRPPENSKFDSSKNVIIGNTVLYGATKGNAYFSGLAGERFAVRNSGAIAVVEGVGDHGCEYMTGGTVVILGTVGVNFAAGMSGGIAYVLDENENLDRYCNLSMVDIEPVIENSDCDLLQKLIEKHYKYTDSKKAEKILKNWNEYLPKFLKVIPTEYKKVLGLMMKEDAETKREEVQIG